MKGCIINDPEELVEENRAFRRKLYTGKHLQVLLMSLRPDEDIGEERHADNDRFFRIEQGSGEVWIDGVASKIGQGHAIIVPAGARRNIVNTGSRSFGLDTRPARSPVPRCTGYETGGQTWAGHNDEVMAAIAALVPPPLFGASRDRRLPALTSACGVLLSRTRHQMEPDRCQRHRDAAQLARSRRSA